MIKESSELNQFEVVLADQSSNDAPKGDATGAMDLSASEAAKDAARDDNKSPALVEKFVIRLPNGLRDRIRQLSEQNRRSMNSEIIMVLESHIRQQFMDTIAEANPEGDFAPGQRKTEAELNKMLESLPAQKKEALLELLG